MLEQQQRESEKAPLGVPADEGAHTDEDKYEDDAEEDIVPERGGPSREDEVEMELDEEEHEDGE